MNWEIYAYYDVDTLTSVFNAIVAIMGGSGFISLLKTAALLGMLMAFSQMLFGKNFEGLHWFMGMFIVYGVLFIPRANVVIIDRVASQPPTVVANVPLGLAFFGHVTSKVGDFLTTEYESNFALPNDLKYQQNGMMFGDRLFSESRRMVIADPNLRNDMFAFIRNCTTYDMLAGRIDPNVYSQTTNLWTLMGNTSQARMTTVKNGNVSMYCNDAYTYLNGLLTTYVQNAQAHYGKLLNPTLTNDSIAASTLASQLPTAYAYMLNASSNAEDIIRQNMMINLSNDAGAVLGQQIGDPNAVQMALAQAQAEATAYTSYITMAKMAADAMPKLKNMIEVVIYALFPIVLIMLFMAGHHAGKVFKQYVMALVWVQLWPPLYAVVNFLMTNSSAQHLKIYGGLGIQSAADAGQTALADQAIAGYMVLLIPVVATAVIKGGEVALSSLADKMLSVQSQSAQSAASQIATGNESYGNASFGNKNINNDNRNSMHHQIDLGAPTSQISATGKDGWATTYHQNGSRSFNEPSNSFTESFTVTDRKAAGLEQAAGTEESHARDLSVAAAKSEAATYSQIYASNSSRERFKELAHADSAGTSDKYSQSVANETAENKSFAQNHRVTETEAAQLRAYAGAGISMPMALKLITGAKADAGVELSKTHAKQLETAYQQLTEGSEKESARKAREFMRTTMHEDSFRSGMRGSDGNSRNIQSGLSDSTELRRAEQESLHKAESLRQSAKLSREHSGTYEFSPTKNVKDFEDIMAKNHINPERWKSASHAQRQKWVDNWAEQNDLNPKMPTKLMDGHSVPTSVGIDNGYRQASTKLAKQQHGQVVVAHAKNDKAVPHMAGDFGKPAGITGNTSGALKATNQGFNNLQDRNASNERFNNGQVWGRTSGANGAQSTVGGGSEAAVTGPVMMAAAGSVVGGAEKLVKTINGDGPEMIQPIGGHGPVVADPVNGGKGVSTIAPAVNPVPPKAPASHAASPSSAGSHPSHISHNDKSGNKKVSETTRSSSLNKPRV